MKMKLHFTRRATQFFGLFLSNTYISVFFRDKIYRGPFKCICIPFLYCHSCPSSTFSCPIGVVQHYMAIHRFPYFLIGHMGFLSLLIGRMPCGWFCPFGLMQDLMYKIKCRKIQIPKAFKALPFAVLVILVLLIPFLTSAHVFSKLCPLGTLVAGIPWVTWNPIDPETGDPTVGAVGFLFAIKMFILGGFLVLFAMSKRPFCRFVCPMGLFFSFFNRISILQLKVSKGCDQCDACRNKCPVDHRVYEDPNARACIRCLQCTTCKHVKVAAPLLHPGERQKGLEETVEVMPDPREREHVAGPT